MEKYYINYIQAVKLKQLGFNKPCNVYYYIGDTATNTDILCEVVPSKADDFNKDMLCISRPLKTQVFDWFRDNNGMYHNIDPRSSMQDGELYFLPIVNDGWLEDVGTYEHAEDVCIDKLIQLCQNK